MMWLPGFSGGFLTIVQCREMTRSTSGYLDEEFINRIAEKVAENVADRVLKVWIAH